LILLKKHIIETEAITPPIRLDPGARWKLDGFGVLALEMLLWCWQARRDPNPGTEGAYGIYGFLMKKLPPFHADFLDVWWYFTHTTVNDFYYRRLQQIPEIKRLVTPLSYDGNAHLARSYIVRKIRERFKSFALTEPRIG
jgi:hypothetical protein